MLTALTAALAPHGLDLIGVAPAHAYDAAVPAPYALAALAPGARSAIVIGNAGGAFWQAFRAYCRTHPGHEEKPHPMDAFTQHAVESATGPVLARAGVPARVVYPFRHPDDPVSFQHLAECAGLGRKSLLGVLVHPVYGPWIALRAALLVPLDLVAPRPADGFDPCPGCVERACIAACPAGAVGPAGWDVPRCAAHRLGDDDPCAPRCHARFDCVIGRAHRPPPEALAYHQSRARPGLAAVLRARR